MQCNTGEALEMALENVNSILNKHLEGVEQNVYNVRKIANLLQAHFLLTCIQCAKLHLLSAKNNDLRI